MSQDPHSPGEAEIATELAGTPTEQSHSTQELHTPQIPPPTGFTILSGPPSRQESQSSDEILLQPKKKRVRLGGIPITMSTDTPVPRRVGDVYSLDEARRYEEIAKEFVNSCAFVLNSFGERLPDIGEVEPPQDLENEAQRAQYIGDLYQHAAQWERISKNLTQRVTTELARASSIPPPATQNRRKFPQPGKYEGGLGDPAITFITQCQNYLATEGTTWPDQYRVRWALQFLEGKAGPWAEPPVYRKKPGFEALTFETEIKALSLDSSLKP